MKYVFGESRYRYSEEVLVGSDRAVTAPVARALTDVPVATIKWTESSRIDIVAQRFVGDPRRWWQIMALNPEWSNPDEIPVGTRIRVPASRPVT